MSKSPNGGNIPPANQSPFPVDETPGKTPENLPYGAPASDKDPKGRLGNYTTAGEHAIVQPGGKQGSDRSNRS